MRHLSSSQIQREVGTEETGRKYHGDWMSEVKRSPSFLSWLFKCVFFVCKFLKCLKNVL